MAIFQNSIVQVGMCPKVSGNWPEETRLYSMITPGLGRYYAK